MNLRLADRGTDAALRRQDGGLQLGHDAAVEDAVGQQSLGLAHGGPLRLVAPAHYGYKNVKHLAAIEFRASRRGYSFPFPYPGLMDHPRGRVALEERARFVPNWLIRPIYKLFVPRAITGR